MSYSTDLRQRVIKFVKNGGTKTEASKRFEVCRDTVYRWLKQHKPQKTGPKSSYKIDLKALELYFQNNQDAYLFEAAERFLVTPQAIFYALKKLGISQKKRGSTENLCIQKASVFKTA